MIASRPFDDDGYIGYDPRPRLINLTRSPTSTLAQSRTRSVTRRQYLAVNHTALELTCSYLSRFLRLRRCHQSVAVVVDSQNSQLRGAETISTVVFW
ncbi:hypothetical protein SLEP1_g14045 [Rubroshorea leprosula]|uniref:Uncharacterized protein n=1 Tax=Rubroshorea leprosula TaxID=152421 RepID=A0AAV5IM97_9ROSI|nr:hypothetical protein SLEP1_g14045 [Rubroshorea leprosula]